MDDNFKKLAEPMPYKWKVQTCNANLANFVAYIDSRDVQNRLDEVLGPMGWEDSYDVYGGNLFCGISIKIEKDLVTTKWDCGVESNMDKEKGQASDAFKRAAVKWGVGRFLYKLKPYKHFKTMAYKGKYKPCENGKIIWNIDDWIQDKVGLCVTYIQEQLDGVKSMAEATPIIEKMSDSDWWCLDIFRFDAQIQDYVDYINARENGDLS